MPRSLTITPVLNGWVVNPPSRKSPLLEAQLKNMFGFDRRASITLAQCVPPPIGCGKPVKGFRDAASAHEFTISGLCQACQDNIFLRP